MTPERKFWNDLRKCLSGHVTRIESATTGGIPDVNLCADGVEVWIELKVATPEYVLLRKEQYAWSKLHSLRGGRVIVLALCGNRIYGWRYPNVLIEPVGKEAKYVKITSAPVVTFFLPLGPSSLMAWITQ